MQANKRARIDENASIKATRARKRMASEHNNNKKKNKNVLLQTYKPFKLHMESQQERERAKEIDLCKECASSRGEMGLTVKL